MGYYGLGPGNNSRMPDKLTPLQQALRSLPLEVALEALAVLEKIMRNIIQQPNEEKLRQLSGSNDKLSPILGNEGGLDVLRAMGWQVDGTDLIVLPQSVKLDFQQHVGKIIDARDYYTKEIEKVKKSAQRAAKTQSPPCGAASTEKSTPDAQHKLLVSAALPECRPSSASTCAPASNRPSDASTEASMPWRTAPDSPARDLATEPVCPPRDLAALSDSPPRDLTSEAVPGVSGQLSNALHDLRRAQRSRRSGTSCPQGHPLVRTKLKPYQGFIHARECSLCGTTIARSGDRLRCEQCRLGMCAVGRSRDTYSVCLACGEPPAALPAQSGANDREEQAAEVPQQTLAAGMSESIKALRQKRYQQSAARS